MSRARDVASLLNTVATDDELTSGLSEKLSYEFASASPTTTASGFLWYDSNSSPAAPKFWDGAAFQALTSGKILQIVRATDGTSRTTTSTSLTDVTGMSVTITPQSSASSILVVAHFLSVSINASNNDMRTTVRITDSSNNALSGSEYNLYGQVNIGTGQWRDMTTLIGWSTPATTSATTYKLRFSVANASNNFTLQNNATTGQLFAIEVSA